MVIEDIQICAEKQECGQCSRPETITFCQCFGCITHTIKRIGDSAHLFGLSTHFSYATSVICDGSKGIHGENIRATHQHTHSSNGCPKDSSYADAWNGEDMR